MDRETEIFHLLDRDEDGRVSRADVHLAAQALNWGWHQAPFFAILDRLTIQASLDQTRLTSILNLVATDALGPYGRVLLQIPTQTTANSDSPSSQKKQDVEAQSDLVDLASCPDIISLLERMAGADVAAEYADVLENLSSHECKINAAGSSLFVIDPQRSFSQGAWMHSMGPIGPDEVQPIRQAFNNVARALKDLFGKVDMAFSRCPFPPDSYDWDPAVKSVLPENQTYFIKPGNDLFWPPTNGFSSWVEEQLSRGKRNVVVGGCTLNSCVRVSAQTVQKKFPDIQVVVDLSLCGARLANYIPTSAYSGRSSVHAAIEEMGDAGVRVVPNVTWEKD